MKDRRGAVLLVSAAVGLVTLTLLALVHPARESERGEPFAIELESASPAAGSGSAACSLPGIVTLARGPRLKAVEVVEKPVSASCVYMFEAGLHGRECLLEFPTAHATALRASNFAARLADFYYGHRQGGIMLPVIFESTHTFVMLDARWCNLLGAADGFSVGEAP